MSKHIIGYYMRIKILQFGPLIAESNLKAVSLSVKRFYYMLKPKRDDGPVNELIQKKRPA